MQVTEKWLGEIGGWQAMKSAREYVRTGGVAEASHQGQVYQGLVGQGGRRYKATLTVKDARTVDCRCACSDAQRGLICSHGLAVALYAISGGPAASSGPGTAEARPGTGTSRYASPVGSSSSRGVTSHAAGVKSADATPKAVLDLNTVPAGKFTVYIPLSHLSQLPKGTVPVYLDFQAGGETKEAEIAQWLFTRGLKCQSMPLRLPAADLGELLTILKGHPRVHNGLPALSAKPSASVTSSLKALLINDLHLSDEIVRVNVSQSIDLQVLSNALSVRSIGGVSSVVDEGAGTIMLLDGPHVNNLRQFLDELFTRRKVERTPRWVAANLGALGEILDVESPAAPLAKVRVVPADPVFGLRLDGSLRRVEASLTVHPVPQASHPVTLGADFGREWRETDLYPIPDPSGDPLRFRHRNLLREQGAWQRLESAGFRMDHQGVLAIDGESEVLRFVATELPRLKELFEIQDGDGWRNATRGLATIRPQMRTKDDPRDSSAADSRQGAGMDWLSLEVAYEAADGFRIARQEVLRLIRSGKRDVRAQDGRRYLLDIEGCEELEETLQDVESRFGHGGQTIAVRSRQLGVLSDFLPAGKSAVPLKVPALEISQIKTLLAELGNTLRPYQLEGVQWLEQHTRSGAAGLLADEMGLGKTVQTLALLRIIRARVNAAGGKGQGGEPVGPALVICPTSLLSNWSEEAARFTPELKTHVSHEAGRKEKLGSLADYDVVFTSYALIIRDLEYYVNLKFCVVVLDEASYIRNPDTAAAKALCQLKAEARFALTGTPVENSIKDLWSIFAFMLPRYLPVLEDFQSRFVKPLSQAEGRSTQSRAIMERLRRLIRPYLFRRTKREVAKDLPEKIEKVVWCELTREQNEVYQRLLEEGREEIRSARKRTGQGSARMTMFTVLLRLRQVCNDLRLLKLGDQFKGQPGGKWPMLEELLQEIIDGGGKALIFSQFVGMLRLVRDKVQSLEIAHSYLDGGTQDRGGQVSAFQSDPERKLFLISLKAGGYGLNLTAADHVLLVDPWWNPAVEAQAIDRAHRIGQGRPVTAYRLATRGTVEEKILKLQEKKRSIMDMTLEDDPTVMAGVSDSELEEMLMGA